jgi:hypothetical protein
VNLNDWVKNGWLAAEPTSGEEIKGLQTIIDRDLRDSEVTGLSDDRRFEAAFNAARTAATIALRATGYRTVGYGGHHERTIESLEVTLGSESKLINRLKALSKKRNATSYDSAGNVSKEELRLMLKTAQELARSVGSWLKKEHPELIA